jgi:hypothetical protein
MKTQVLRAVRLLLLVAVVLTAFVMKSSVAYAAADETTEEWALKALLTLAPPEKMITVRKDETIEEMRIRYASIAKDLAEVVDNEKPLFGGKNGRRHTAALLLSIGYFESGFTKGVGSGKVRGDGGRSWCYMQINIGKGKVYFGTAEMLEWKGPDLVGESATKCFKVGLETIRMSMAACRSRAQADWLSAYTSGRCQDNEPKARSRWSFAHTLRQRVAAATPPAAVVAAPEPTTKGPLSFY